MLATTLTLYTILRGIAMMIWHRLNTLLARLYDPIDRIENLFLKMKNISMMTNQIIFLMLADRIFIREPKITCLYTLMFYNVVTYSISYIKELIEKEDWSLYVTVTERSKIKHLAMSATKIVFEWTKAVTFIVTLTFMLLVFGLEQGLEHYKPSMNYTMITWIYYLATEKVFVEMFPPILKFLRFDTFENLEELYAPVILKSFTISVSASLIVILLPLASYKLLFVAAYSNVYLRLKDLLQISAPALSLEREILNRYRKATPKEIKQFDDVCPVCLCDMISARITPCYHLFHASCLRRCLKTNNTCPMCKRELTFGSVSTQ
ncbi:ERAD-associated E3 ubiquitin-protein ligase HRD1B-like isoform X1 [Bombus vosnesenskii]|uniref:ERAD-associated E3 ubiquitin-protein ligase HRD1B-like isoform X1 n=2 Tax=Bombus vosnesenskii TaxID=207650 RepID=A0A6J3K4J3_9HYME|nr:ERAD-associated E3 ubiquitin-protein ligase HRD1B-like isoform X1 [Bombus vosnesenskii]